MQSEAVSKIGNVIALRQRRSVSHLRGWDALPPLLIFRFVSKKKKYLDICHIHSQAMKILDSDISFQGHYAFLSAVLHHVHDNLILLSVLALVSSYLMWAALSHGKVRA